MKIFQHFHLTFSCFLSILFIDKIKICSTSSRCKRLSQFLDLLNIPRHHSGHSGSSSSSNNSQQHSPQTPHAASVGIANCFNHASSNDGDMTEQEQQQQYLKHGSRKRSSCVSFRSEILLFDLVNGEINDLSER